MEIQDEKVTSEVNGAQSECKSKSDTRWGEGKAIAKKEPSEADKDKKNDNKAFVKKECVESEKDKK